LDNDESAKYVIEQLDDMLINDKKFMSGILFGDKKGWEMDHLSSQMCISKTFLKHISMKSLTNSSLWGTNKCCGHER
jgi:hypothetical protein